MGTIKWIRPSGKELTTNDTEATIDYCISLGFELVEEKKKKKKKAK